MTPAHLEADQDLLHKLLLGQLPSAEVERLAAEYADDSRLAVLAESLADSGDTLLDSLRNHATPVDLAAERLIERLLERLRLARLGDETGPLDSSPSATVSAESAAQPPERLEYFRLLKVLGQGGMGTVYLAEDTRLGRQVALKTLRPELAANSQAKDRFLREARTAAKLEHDHIVPIYYVGEADGTPFLAMPLLRGESLHALLQRTAGPLPVALAIRLAREAAAGLAAAHACGLIHRDIKPANLWIEAPGGRVKVLDFGLARSVTEDVHITAIGAILGTPAYMAPEQARGLPADHRADLFSLGCVLYEMLTGQRPFAGADTMAILASLALDTPPAPHTLNPRCPAGLSQLVMRLLEKTPDARPASAQEVVQALPDLDSSATENVPIQAATPRAGIDAPADTASVQPPLRAPSPRRRRLPVLAAAALLLALVGVGIFFGGQIIRVVTNQGELVVEVDDPAVEVKIVQNGVVVQDKTSKREFTLSAGKGAIEVLEKDGIKLATRQFELTRGGKTTVKVTLQELADARKPKDPGPAVKKAPPAIPASADSDRRAAEWVLLIGGGISITENGKERPIEAVGDLPRGAFELTVANLNQNPKVSDAGLAHFKGCKNLTGLHLHNTKVSDAGLAHFKDCRNLTFLRLSATLLSDAGLAHFKACKNLVFLELDPTQVSDAGLAHFKDCKNLGTLWLQGTQVSDAGLAHFKDCKNLTFLSLRTTQVSDAGLAFFKDCKNLTDLRLGSTHVSDAGLAYFKDCKNLTFLDLGSTQVSDAGLAHFKDCKNLTELHLGGTRVSDAGLADLESLPRLVALTLTNTRISLRGLQLLKAALAKCQITSWSEPNRSVAESVLALGGTVEIGPRDKPESRPVKVAADLPGDYFQVRRVSLAGVAKSLTKLGEHLSWLRFPEFDRLESIDLSRITGVDYGFLAPIHGLQELSLAKAGLNDAALAQLPKLPALKRLVLDGNGIGGPGLTSLDKQPALTELSLASAGLTDESLVAKLPKLPALKRLVLDGNDIRGRGLTSLIVQPELTDLSLSCPTLGDLSAKVLAELKQVKRLSLAGSGLTDAGIKHLAGLTNLEWLNLRRTKASAAGIAELQKALPKCKIEWDGMKDK